MGTWLYLITTLALLDAMLIETINEEIDLLDPRQQFEYLITMRGCLFASFVGAMTAAPLL
ncbi:hypothetical protein [Stenotrophomonas sp. GD03657]|uniref:hypothetical protein n=1 Tax=Stenotrophomonas sp. GD03657 TaxID=2975363 RepID=UPI00244BCD23|nr:hypothetical protein [Stenotrophomonas sp. GD03657]MDH2154333.1 hypothetical protein [Stenotrophomonas sp. GD03657]